MPGEFLWQTKSKSLETITKTQTLNICVKLIVEFKPRPEIISTNIIPKFKYCQLPQLK